VRADFTSREHLFGYVQILVSRSLGAPHKLRVAKLIKKAFLNTEYVEKVHQFKIISNADDIGKIWVA